ncbi:MULTISPECIES: oxidoreductase [Micromonospora]|uniref:oxidoreductase n=1 Tax=Micromonospora TaxID=1873 RepID=UPI0005C4F3C4|nr:MULTISPECIES: oxidoreductase [Micromonospora]
MTANSITAEAAGTLTLGGDLPVRRLGFGAMRLAFGGSVRDPETAATVLRSAVDSGVNHIDTAGFYGFGDLHSHEVIRQALFPYPADLVIATKVGPVIEGGVVPTAEAKPDQLRQLVEEDLRRLGVDRLDLVYLRVGGATAAPGGVSIGDRFAALAQLREEGLIRHLGVSNVDAEQLAEAQAIAPVAAVQNQFHVHFRGDSELVAQCAKDGIAYVPFFPVGGGGAPIDHDRLKAVAERHGATTRQVALAWLLAVSPAILAIPGTSVLDHLTENIAAAGLALTDEDMAALSE